jgi:hypothetical protein
MKTMQESRSLAQGISIIDDTAKATAETPRSPRQTPRLRIEKRDLGSILRFSGLLGVFLGALGVSAVALLSALKN